MKKIIILLLLELAIAFNLEIAHSQSSVGVGIQIRDTFGPAIDLINPINNSGSPHGNITFSYIVIETNDIKNCSLIINNKINQTNDSFVIKAPSTSSFNLTNLALGSYNWSINCTDSLGNIGSSPINKFTIQIFTNFNESVFNLSNVDLRNVTNFVVETSSFGKINFSDFVDLSQGFDLNKYINISFNRIKLNSTALFALNKSATLQIVGLTFSNPRIVRDGVVCPETICKKVSYSGGILTFNVSHWTSYESEETPASESPQESSGTSSGGGGGGGGGGTPPAIPIITDFSIDKTTLKVVLKQGQTKTETLTVKNIGTTIFDVTALLSDIVKFKVSPEAHELTATLKPNEEKVIEIVFTALENEIPDIYPAKIRLKSPSVEKEVDAVIEVDSAEPLFDVDAEVLSESKKIFPGQELLLEVSLFNVRGFGRVDVNVDYAIKDFKGNIVASEHETLAVETQAKFTRSLLVPSDLLPGSYVALVKVTYADSVGTSSDIFEVEAKSIRLSLVQLKDYRIILSIGAAVLIFGVLVFSAYRLVYLKKKAPAAKIDTVGQLKEVKKTQKLKKELEALEQARKSGFISEESYQKDKKRIEEKLNK